ncbi:MAG: dTDP-glucose 4,6-dehydratase [Thermoprotei archaeon]
MKILVTGGLGFIGSNFIRYILHEFRDVRVINLDSLSSGSNIANLKDIEKDIRYSFIKGDIANKRLVNKIINQVDIVVNIAAETHVDRSIANPWPFIKSNVIGALTIFEACVKLKKRVVHVSTDEVYGDILQGSFQEEDRLKPSSPYSASKAAADMFALAYHRTYDLDVVIVRSTNNFGPYQFPEKLIPKTIIRAHSNLPIPIYGKGQNVRDWIYVKDFSTALTLLLTKGKGGEIYNVSAGNELQNIELVTQILSLMNKPLNLITFVEDRPGHDIRYSLDSSKIRNELGWKPEHNFQEALKATIDWYMNNEWWWKPIATQEVLHPTPWKIKW